jgi:hypothetical protein
LYIEQIMPKSVEQRKLDFSSQISSPIFLYLPIASRFFVFFSPENINAHYATIFWICRYIGTYLYALFTLKIEMLSFTEFGFPWKISDFDGNQTRKKQPHKAEAVLNWISLYFLLKYKWTNLFGFFLNNYTNNWYIPFKSLF